jgi:hypothetical protein
VTLRAVSVTNGQLVVQHSGTGNATLANLSVLDNQSQTPLAFDSIVATATTSTTASPAPETQLSGTITVNVQAGTISLGRLTAERNATAKEQIDSRKTERSIRIQSLTKDLKDSNGKTLQPLEEYFDKLAPDGMILTTIINKKLLEKGTSIGNPVETKPETAKTVVRQLTTNVDFGLLRAEEVPSVKGTQEFGSPMSVVSVPVAASTRGNNYFFDLNLGEANELNWNVYIDWNQADFGNLNLDIDTSPAARTKLLSQFQTENGTFQSYQPDAGVDTVENFIKKTGNPDKFLYLSRTGDEGTASLFRSYSAIAELPGASSPRVTRFGYQFDGQNTAHASAFFITIVVRMDPSIQLVRGVSDSSENVNEFRMITIRVNTVITDKDIVVKPAALPTSPVMPTAVVQRGDDQSTAPSNTQTANPLVENRENRQDVYFFRTLASDPESQAKDLPSEDKGILQGDNFRRRLADLKDGRYRLILKRRDGSEVPLLEFLLRDGRPVNPIDAELERLRRLEESGEQDKFLPDGILTDEGVEKPGGPAAGGDATDDQTSVEQGVPGVEAIPGAQARDVAKSQHPDAAEALGAGVATGANAAESLAEVASGDSEQWRNRVDDYLRSVPEGTFSKAGRLARRLAAHWHES